MALGLSSPPTTTYPAAPPVTVSTEPIAPSPSAANAKATPPRREPAGYRSDRIALLIWLGGAAIMASMLLKDLVVALIFP